MHAHIMLMVVDNVVECLLKHVKKSFQLTKGSKETDKR